MRAKILVVEDDENLGVALAYNLADVGFDVDRATTGAQARGRLRESGYDLVILDIMLPDTDGYTLCRQLRADGHRARVLMLTARTLEEDIVRGFDAGADDYVAKPYRLAELFARVRALLRRDGGVQSASLNFGGFRLEREGRAVYDSRGAVVELTPKEFELLDYLLRHQDRALARQQILDAVWGEDVVVADRTIDNFVSSLKKKLGWTPSATFRIRTVRGVGYRMEVEPSTGDEGTGT